MVELSCAVHDRNNLDGPRLHTVNDAPALHENLAQLQHAR